MEILDKGRSLIITSDKGVSAPKASIDVENSVKFGKRVITALYRDGVSEIELNYSSPNYANIIQEVISEQIVGFEIVKQDSRSCILKDLSGIN